MQDRFKFRVWYNPQPTYDDYPKMLYDAENTYDFMRTPDLIPADSFGELLEDKDFIVMQCTGLKDKNGKLIYEGDIVNYSCLPGYSDIYACTFNNGSFLIGGLLISNTHLKSEVIGNIYENKELLNEI